MRHNLWGRVKVYETNPFFVNGIWPWPSGLFCLAVKKLKMDEIESWSTEILIIRLTEQDIGCIGFRVFTSLLIWYIFECRWNCKTTFPNRFNLYFIHELRPKKRMRLISRFSGNWPLRISKFSGYFADWEKDKFNEVLNYSMNYLNDISTDTVTFHFMKLSIRWQFIV